MPILKLTAYGSKTEMSELVRIVIAPPYCGVPRLSHQLPVEVVVTAVVAESVVVLVVLTTDVGVVLVVLTIEVVDAGADVVVDELQDASSIAAIIKKLKNNQVNLLFNFILHFNQ
jgi:hypothetical protein